MSSRGAVVAGKFYTDDPKSLRRQVGEWLRHEGSQQPARAAVSPHAGYMFSGATAGKTLGSVKIPGQVILLGPNHTGRGKELSLYPDGEWETPLGKVLVCPSLNKLLLKHCPCLETDTRAHEYEHSLEVQLPFLQVLNPEVQICAVAIWTASMELLNAFGQGLARAIAEFGKDVFILASSDMTHFEAAAAAEKKDRLAIDKILAVDAAGLARTVSENNISMCGWAPTVAMLAALDDSACPELVHYTNSGETIGDTDSVVGYAGIIIR
ncbi:AmmeMemoRadiSam system protein B [Planctomycetota bacterium]